MANVSVFFICYSIAVSVRTHRRPFRLPGRKKVIIPAMLLFSLSIIGIGAVWNTARLAAAGLVFGASHGFLYPAMISHVIDSQAFEEPGKINEYLSLLQHRTTVRALACGFLAHGFGYRMMFFMVGGTLLVFRDFSKILQGLTCGNGSFAVSTLLK